LFWYPELSVIKFILEARLVLEYGTFFAFGSLLAILKFENIKPHTSLLILLLLVLTFCVFIRAFDLARFFILPPLVILTGLMSMPIINNVLTKLGDVSYGIYIYAFPVQQTLMHYFRFNTMELIVSSIIISFSFGYLSWHCIEKHALRLK
jgi:peptidoglycan/LPS O-acetylase OafA/YrhL